MEGHITALRTDMTQVERLKVEVPELLMPCRADQHAADGHPASGTSCCRIYWPNRARAAGQAVSLTMSNADFFSDFTAAGINQTLQTLKVKFTISLTILTTVGYETVDVDSDVMLAQTVIVGTVPETYVNLGHLTTTEGWKQYGTETGN